MKFSRKNSPNSQPAGRPDRVIRIGGILPALKPPAAWRAAEQTMHNIKFGYKVVSRFRGEWVSFHALALSVVYEPGHWVRPPPAGGPLSVFSDLSHARKFLSDLIQTGPRSLGMVRMAIFRCMWLPWEQPLPRYHGSAMALWNGQDHLLATALPKGTRLASAVRLLG